MYDQKIIDAWVKEGDKPCMAIELGICFNQQYPELIKKVPFGVIYHFLKSIEKEERIKLNQEKEK